MAWPGRAWHRRNSTNRAPESGVKMAGQSPTNKNMTTTIEPKKKKQTEEAMRAIAERNNGEITPEIVLAEAKRKSSPLHGFFCWDNTKAAEEYRKIQAAGLIRRIKVTINTGEESSIRIRAFVNVTPELNEDPDQPEKAGRGIYVSIETACTVDSYKSQMIQQAKRDVEAFRRKYAALAEVSRIITAMEHFEAEFSID
jgi:predicted RNA-binding protein YlxR (DUF448 family)